MSKFTDAELAECARRKVSQRRRVYTRLVREEKMTHYQAEREVAMMSQIAADYAERSQPSLFAREQEDKLS